MGCFNETCGATGIPILHGDPIAYFLIEYNLHNHQRYSDTGHSTSSLAPVRHHSGCCYSTDIWQPVTVPVYGEYNDYGNIEEEETGWKQDFLLAAFKTEGLEVNSIQEIGDMIHDDSVSLSGHPIGQMMVHRWAYDLLALEVESDLPTIYPNMTLDMMVECGNKFYNILLEPNDDMFADDASLLRFNRSMRRRMMFLDEDEEFRSNSFVSLALGRYRIPHRFHEDTLGILAKAAVGKVPVEDEKVQAVILELAKFFNFGRNFERLNRGYFPQYGKSQDTSYKTHKLLLKASLDHIEERERLWNEEYGDEDAEA